MLIAVVVLVFLAGTGLLVGATIGIDSPAELVLGMYVVAFVEIVASSLFLSTFDSLTRGSLVSVTIILFAASAAVWVLRGAPRPPAGAPSGVLRPWPARALAVVVSLALAYVVALIVATPPNGWDPLNYHLARAAFWLESGHVGYIRDAYDQRLNFNPPDGEIGMAFALGVARDEHAAGFVQFFAALACGISVYALARRFGLPRSEALFGGLLFLTLPIVLLQSSGAKNDVVLASFALAACVFALGSTRRAIVLASLATALAIGTKFTAAYALPLLLGLALAAPPRSWRVRRLAAIATGALVGAYWYVVNVIETGKFLGDQSGTGTLTAPFHARENLLTAYGDAVDTLDLSGAQGRGLVLYAVGGAVLALAVAVATRRWWQAVIAGVLVALPLALLELSSEVGRPTLLRLYDWLGKPHGYLALTDAVAASPRTASDTASWFGPLGFLAVVGAAAAAVVLARRRAAGTAAHLAAWAPLVWLVLVALTLTYHPWQGRFFIAAVALSASLWGLALRITALAWSAVAIAAVTAFLCLDHYVEKPAGSVWHEARWQVQSQHDPPIGPVFRFVDENVPDDDAIALALGPNEFSFPFFGPHLERRVELTLSNSTRWLFADTQREGQVDANCWRARLRSERGTVFEREPGCA